MREWVFTPFPGVFETGSEPYVPVVIQKPKRRPSGSSVRRREYVRPDPTDTGAYAAWEASGAPTSASRIAEELTRWFGAICQLCREPIDMELTGHHPAAWNVDHILPKAKGGSHTWGNLQLAHRECNIQKGDLALPEPPPWLYAKLRRAAVSRFENEGIAVRSELERLRYRATLRVAVLAMTRKGIGQGRKERVFDIRGFTLYTRKARALKAINKVARLQTRLISEHEAELTLGKRTWR